MKRKQTIKGQPQRILQYIGSLATGGSQSMIMGVYRNIDRTKFQFDFVVDKPEDIRYEEEIEALGGKIYFLPPYKIYNSIEFHNAWKRLFREHTEYKVIHSHVRTTAAMVFKIAKRYGLKTIAHSHNTSNGDGLVGRVKNFYQRNLTKYSDVNLACSEKAGEFLFRGDSFSVLNNGIDFGQYTYNESKRKITRKKLKLAESEFVVCQIGRLTVVKNQLFSIDLLKKMIEKGIQAKLLIVGNGPDRDKIKDYIDDQGLMGAAIMLGDRSDVPDILLASDVFVMPSLYEGLPLSLVEAQASSLPCLVSDMVHDGIFNENVKTLPLNNVDEWIREMEKCLKQTKQRASRKMGENDFGVLETVRRLEEIYVCDEKSV